MISSFLLFIGQTEIIILVVLLILLFGAKKIPELAKGIGKGIKEFKNATKDDGIAPENKEIKDDDKETDAKS